MSFAQIVAKLTPNLASQGTAEQVIGALGRPCGRAGIIKIESEEIIGISYVGRSFQMHRRIQMRIVFFVFLLVFTITGWAEGSRLIYVPPPKNPNLVLEIYFETPSERRETIPFSPFVAVGPDIVDANIPTSPGRPPGFYLGIEIYDKSGKIVRTSNRTVTFELKPGMYLLKCWSDSDEIKCPEDIQFEIVPNKMKTIELVFKSMTVTMNQIDKSEFERE